MQRGSDRMSAHRDDEMKHELQGLLRSGHPTRTEEWHGPEPPAEDDPDVTHGPVTPGRGPTYLEALRLELARTLRHGNAPDALVGEVDRLPDRARYGNVQKLAVALTEAGPTRPGGA
ncbi:DUF2795 domain-containing protein [Streptomyces parvulus]|uniref:DUF2795 domain-containing protein n=1 Tax=Streptomyces parvulus TaxID=146923 RepID=UPI0033B80981